MLKASVLAALGHLESSAHVTSLAAFLKCILALFSNFIGLHGAYFLTLSASLTLMEGKGAYEEAARAKLEQGLAMELRTVEDILREG
jgi:hypothetical protein